MDRITVIRIVGHDVAFHKALKCAGDFAKPLALGLCNACVDPCFEDIGHEPRVAAGEKDHRTAQVDGLDALGHREPVTPVEFIIGDGQRRLGRVLQGCFKGAVVADLLDLGRGLGSACGPPASGRQDCRQSIALALQATRIVNAEESANLSQRFGVEGG